MNFEVGKCYKHTTGTMMHVLCETETILYGRCLVAEEAGKNDLIPIGKGEEYADNWTCIPIEEFQRFYNKRND